MAKKQTTPAASINKGYLRSNREHALQAQKLFEKYPSPDVSACKHPVIVKGTAYFPKTEGRKAAILQKIQTR